MGKVEYLYIQGVSQKRAFLSVYQAFSQECVTEKLFSYFSTNIYVVGTQKNRLNETILLRTHNICLNVWVRKYLQFYVYFLFVYLNPWFII